MRSSVQVQENDGFESLRLDRAAYVFCFRKCNSVSMDPTELPSSSKKVSDWNEEEQVGTREEIRSVKGRGACRRLDVEMIDQVLTLEVCIHMPIGFCYVGSYRESTRPYEFGVCWLNLCNITASSVTFSSRATQTAP